MKEFRQFLEGKGYTLRSANSYNNLLGFYLTWCKENGVNHKKANLDELYNYQAYNRSIGNGIGYIRQKNKSVELYFQFIKRKDNPALLVKTEKRETKLPKNMLDEQYLLNIYINLPANTITEKRNKTVTGLFIFQGVKRSELDLMEVEHFDFANNRIYIPATNRTNARHIAIQPFQKMELQKYVFEIRPQLLIEAKKQTNKLFFSQGTGDKLNNVMSIVLKQIKIDFPYVHSLAQLQQSRIQIWLKEFGLRETQYRCGFRYASSVERYATKNNDALREKLKHIHPFERIGIS